MRSQVHTILGSVQWASWDKIANHAGEIVMFATNASELQLTYIFYLGHQTQLSLFV